MKTRLILFGLLLILVLFSLIGYGSASDDNQPFDIDHPPDGWYRFEDPVLGYAIWLPEEWIAMVNNGPEVFLSTYYWLPYQNLDGKVNLYLDVGAIPYLRFQAVRQNPVQESPFQDFPTDKYDIVIGDLSIPCARYEYYQHNCVIGPYPVEQFFPKALTPGDFSILMSLQLTDATEEIMMHDWQWIVTSFVLENPPESLP